MLWFFTQKFFHSLHLVSMVAWFAGLFYLVRLYVYHQEAEEKLEENQKNKKEKEKLTARIEIFRVMERRLALAITTPAMILTLTAGSLSAWLGGYFSQPWMHAKLSLVLLLVIYHHHLIALRKTLALGSTKKSSKFFRLYNELATLFLITIVSLAVFRQLPSALIATSLLLAIFLLTFVVVFFKQRLR